MKRNHYINHTGVGKCIDLMYAQSSSETRQAERKAQREAQKAREKAENERN